MGLLLLFLWLKEKNPGEEEHQYLMATSRVRRFSALRAQRWLFWRSRSSFSANASSTRLAPVHVVLSATSSQILDGMRDEHNDGSFVDLYPRELSHSGSADWLEFCTRAPCFLWMMEPHWRTSMRNEAVFVSCFNKQVKEGSGLCKQFQR